MENEEQKKRESIEKATSSVLAGKMGAECATARLHMQYCDKCQEEANLFE